MKKYWKQAGLSDGRKVIGYFVSEMPEGVCGFTEDAVDYKWMFWDAKTFKERVKEEKVQGFVWENGKVVCGFNQEEKDVLKKVIGPLAFSAAGMRGFEKDFENEIMVFACKDFERVVNGETLLFGSDGVMQMLGMSCAQLFMYGDLNLMRALEGELKREGSLFSHLRTNNASVGALAFTASGTAMVESFVKKYDIELSSETKKVFTELQRAQQDVLIGASGRTAKTKKASTFDDIFDSLFRRD